jgi:hypothetical protein
MDSISAGGSAPAPNGVAFRQFVEKGLFAKGMSADKFDDLAAPNRGWRGKTARKNRSLSE